MSSRRPASQPPQSSAGSLPVSNARFPSKSVAAVLRHFLSEASDLRIWLHNKPCRLRNRKNEVEEALARLGHFEAPRLMHMTRKEEARESKARREIGGVRHTSALALDQKGRQHEKPSRRGLAAPRRDGATAFGRNESEIFARPRRGASREVEPEAKLG